MSLIFITQRSDSDIHLLLFWSTSMTRTPLVAIVIAATATLAASAFASGYGPAPYYQPAEGAPASQRGISVQTLSAGEPVKHPVNEAGAAPAGQEDAAQAVITMGDKH